MKWFTIQFSAALVRTILVAAIGALCVFLGFSPQDWITSLLVSPPLWLFQPLTRLAIIAIGVLLIIVLSQWERWFGSDLQKQRRRLVDRALLNLDGNSLAWLRDNYASGRPPHSIGDALLASGLIDRDFNGHTGVKEEFKQYLGAQLRKMYSPVRRFLSKLLMLPPAANVSVALQSNHDVVNSDIRRQIFDVQSSYATPVDPRGGDLPGTEWQVILVLAESGENARIVLEYQGHSSGGVGGKGSWNPRQSIPLGRIEQYEKRQQLRYPLMRLSPDDNWCWPQIEVADWKIVHATSRGRIIAYSQSGIPLGSILFWTQRPKDRSDMPVLVLSSRFAFVDEWDKEDLRFQNSKDANGQRN